MFDFTKNQYAETPVARIIWERLADYGKSGSYLGNFLEACVRNDWKEAVARADDTNVKFMYEIMIFLCNEMPSQCFGSPAKVDLWRLRHGHPEERMHIRFADQLEKAEEMLAKFSMLKTSMELEGIS